MALIPEEEQPLLGSKQTTPGCRGDQRSIKQRCATMSAKRGVCYGVLMLLGLALVLSALLLIPWGMAEIYNYVINLMMQLDPKSPLYAEWLTPNIPMYQSFYFFDIQNPEEFKAGGKPEVIQRGPYVYKLGFDRLNLSRYDNGTLSFRPRYLYSFAEERSVGPESDRFITLNMPLVTVAYFVRNSGFAVRKLTNGLMELLGEKLTLNKTVEELLWGYDEPLFKLIQPIITIPGFDQGEFGFLLGFNDTIDNLYTVNDGVANRSLVNLVERFQGMASLPWWYGEANDINGTDGTMYHPYISRAEKLYLFHPDLCRSVPYLYEKDTVFKDVPLLKFTLASYAYSNGSDYPPNAGFCKKDHDLCGPSGIMRQDPCRFGSPSAISNPHFFQGDPALYEAVGGLDPQAKYHQHYMEIEPLMGMPYILKMRLQISMETVPVPDLTEVENVRNMMMPVLWFEQSVEANDRILNYYKTGFVLTAYIAMIVKWIIFAIGILVFLLTVYKFAKRIAYPPVGKMEEQGNKSIQSVDDEQDCGGVTNLAVTTEDMANGGVANGGVVNGGMVNGGVVNGGMVNGGVANGHVAKEGVANGDVTKGAVANGGVANGVMATGGVANDSMATGDVAHGGSAIEGVASVGVIN